MARRRRIKRERVRQPFPPAWIEALLNRDWTKEASQLVDQWLVAAERHLEEAA